MDRPLNSKQRYRLKRRAADEVKRIEADAAKSRLRAAGAKCGNCIHFSAIPDLAYRGQFMCELSSDFNGYSLAKKDGICTAWTGNPK